MENKSTVEIYLEDVTKEHRGLLTRIRETIFSTVPNAQEGISYGAPGFTYRGRPIAAFASYEDHCVYYPMSSTVIDELRAELSGFEILREGIHFHTKNPLSEELVKKLLQVRVQEIQKND